MQDNKTKYRKRTQDIEKEQEKIKEKRKQENRHFYMQNRPGSEATFPL